ncbi:MAG: hypothetical protein EHM72_06770, partial [Calditrichaeota bacterium]
NVFPHMYACCSELAERQIPQIIEKSLTRMNRSLGGELNRLVALSRVNRNIRREEIASCERDMQSLSAAFQSARLRLDALRLIFRGQMPGVL